MALCFSFGSYTLLKRKATYGRAKRDYTGYQSLFPRMTRQLYQTMIQAYKTPCKHPQIQRSPSQISDHHASVEFTKVTQALQSQSKHLKNIYRARNSLIGNSENSLREFCTNQFLRRFSEIICGLF